jgi:SAM-dependent methyltransferase
LSGYTVETVTVRIGNDDYHLRRLSDRQQFHDPDGHAERAGIFSAAWPMFGMIWPVGLALADEMTRVEIGGRRILEVGCGLALSTLVLARRGADVTASDHHPLAEEFLRHNLALKALPAVPYQDAPWETSNDSLGWFDLIVGSDVLYEPNHAMLLAGFIERHAAPQSQLLIADAGRGYRGQFARRLAAQGFIRTELPCRVGGAEIESRGRILKFERGAVNAGGS